MTRTPIIKKNATTLKIGSKIRAPGIHQSKDPALETYIKAVGNDAYRLISSVKRRDNLTTSEQEALVRSLGAWSGSTQHLSKTNQSPPSNKVWNTDRTHFIVCGLLPPASGPQYTFLHKRYQRLSAQVQSMDDNNCGVGGMYGCG